MAMPSLVATPVIFIDANIFLRFFDSNGSEYRKLLNTLDEIKDCLFTTQQTLNEVNRNKLTIAVNSVTETLKNFPSQNISLPTHFDLSPELQAQTWNDQWYLLQKKLAELKVEFQDYTSQLLDNIERSQDSVSIVLEKIFREAKAPMENELKAAELRKKLGNPPGKKNDPIGDELAWEQILSSYNPDRPLWIVSNDNDFFEDFRGKLRLNPFLFAELQERAKEKIPEVKVFKKLSDAITCYRKEFSPDSESIPINEEMQKIVEEEQVLIPTSYHEASFYADKSFWARPLPCPRCKVESLFPQSFSTGYRYLCAQCGYSTPLFPADDPYF